MPHVYSSSKRLKPAEKKLLADVFPKSDKAVFYDCKGRYDPLYKAEVSNQALLAGVLVTNCLLNHVGDTFEGLQFESETGRLVITDDTSLLVNPIESDTHVKDFLEVDDDNRAQTIGALNDFLVIGKAAASRVAELSASDLPVASMSLLRKLAANAETVNEQVENLIVELSSVQAATPQ